MSSRLKRRIVHQGRHRAPAEQVTGRLTGEPTAPISVLTMQPGQTTVGGGATLYAADNGAPFVGMIPTAGGQVVPARSAKG